MINKRLLQFLKAVENRIEARNDKGHNMIHINTVLYYAYEINNNLENKIDEEVILVTVYLHDLFCYKNRDEHHVLASEFARNSSFMKRYFNEETREMIATAIYKHRTRFKDRESDLEKILYDADKLDGILNINRMIERSILYNVKNNKNKFIFNDVYNHLKDKYGYDINLYYTTPYINKEYGAIKQILNNKILFTVYYEKVKEQLRAKKAI